MTAPDAGEVYDLTITRSNGGHDRIVLHVDLGVTLQYACAEPGQDEIKVDEQAQQSPAFLRLIALLMSARFDDSMGVHEYEYDH